MTRKIATSAIVLAFISLAGVAAQKPEVTDVPAVRGRQWGMSTYRLAVTGQGTTSLRVEAQLVDDLGKRIGEFVRVRHFENSDDPEFDRPKQREQCRLEWGRETVEIDTDAVTGTFRVKYNGIDVGEARVGPDQKTIEPRLSAFTKERRELLEIASAVGDDIDKVWPAHRGKRQYPDESS
jgi:hypothetical protein